jgi:hypothetical protein
MVGIAPITGRVGHVGGIESITVDGRRWYFGFDFRSDLVVSPLIDDSALMAAFAAQHMRQVDGPHDADYWSELVEMSVNESELADDADRVIDTSHPLTHHLEYLLGCACQWDGALFDEPAIVAALDTIGVAGDDQGWDCIDAVTAALDAAGPAQDAARYFLRRNTEYLLDRAPANWPDVFSALRS